ncbi:MAG: ABC-F family ATP-binding cassette domain-containing protein [Bacillota bacterium]|nr:ABC-F family ATP-binding cassette domain-containing protein [Bacillota bacterium]
MSILTVKNLNHGFGDRAIFENVSFRLLKGEHIGLIGANGEGKSTFMNIITHKLDPDEGTIEWSKRVRTGYLDQHSSVEDGKSIKDVLLTAFQYLYDMEAEMNDMYVEMGSADEARMDELMNEVGTIQDILNHNDFYNIEAKVNDVARGLGLHEFGMDTEVNSLSGGQKTKVLLAKLLEKPDILLLDEPTNFLDVQHIEWLKKYLQEYEDAFILISHDIPFLNSVVNLIYHMENRELNRYVGDYDNFLRINEAKKKQIEAAYKQQQQEIADLEDFVQRNKARVATRNMAMSRQKKLDKMDRIELAREKPKPEFHFKSSRTSGKLIFRATDLVIGYDKPLSRPLNLVLERGQKVAIVGANGVGKTTLLRSLLGEIPAISGKVETGEFLHIGYFEQEIKEANYNTALEEYWKEFPSLNQGEVRSALAKAGLTYQHIESKVLVLSGGEQAKVRLAKLMGKETNLLVLDEPTNHLDVDAKAELNRALKEYKGTVLLISHEPDFYTDFVTDVWNLEQWTTKLV